MMASGTRPAENLHRVRSFEHKYGASAISTIPDFNVDRGGWNPDQNNDNRPYGCVGYTSADYFYDVTGLTFSHDFCLAGAKYLAGEKPTGLGTSFHAGLDARVGMGGLLANQTMGLAAADEFTAEDWSKWFDAQKKQAHNFDQNGVRDVLGNGDAFDSIILACYQTRRGVSIGSPWIYEAPSDFFTGQWIKWNADYTCPSPNPATNYFFFPWHSYAIKGKKTINGVPYAIVKFWRSSAADFVYFNRETLNLLMSINGAGALTIDPNANRWAALIGIIVRRFPNVGPLAPQLIKHAWS